MDFQVPHIYSEETLRELALEETIKKEFPSLNTSLDKYLESKLPDLIVMFWN